jgi:hypothetical protein
MLENMLCEHGRTCNGKGGRQTKDKKKEMKDIGPTEESERRT